MADTFAAIGVAPLPLYTVIAPSAATGRIQEKTGIPIRSSPVISATRVIPAFHRRSFIISYVSSGDLVR